MRNLPDSLCRQFLQENDSVNLWREELFQQHKLTLDSFNKFPGQEIGDVKKKEIKPRTTTQMNQYKLPSLGLSMLPTKTVGIDSPSKLSMYDLHHQYITQSNQTPSTQRYQESNVSLYTLDQLQANDRIPTQIQEQDSEDNNNIFVNVSTKKLRPRIVSVPVEQKVQPSTIQKSKRFIFKMLKQVDSTFIAIAIKPNLALLRNKGFYELDRAENILRSSLEKDHKKPQKNLEILKKPQIDYKKQNVVKISKFLLNRSVNLAEQVIIEEEEQYKATHITIQKLSKEQEMKKLLKAMSPLRQKQASISCDKNSESRPYLFNPINKNYFNIMKRRQKNKKKLDYQTNIISKYDDNFEFPIHEQQLYDS